MPFAPKRICAEPRCPERVDRGYCPKHRRQRDAVSRFDKHPGYRTEQWKQYSRRRLAEHPWCVLCGRLAQCTDHVQPAATHPELFFEESNHRSLCWSCNRATARPTGGH